MKYKLLVVSFIIILYLLGDHVTHVQKFSSDILDTMEEAVEVYENGGTFYKFILREYYPRTPLENGVVNNLSLFIQLLKNSQASFDSRTRSYWLNKAKIQSDKIISKLDKLIKK